MKISKLESKIKFCIEESTDKFGCVPEEDVESLVRLLTRMFVEIIQREKRKGRIEALEEVKKKFGGALIINRLDGDWIKLEPELDVYLEEELVKLKNKSNGKSNEDSNHE